MAKATKKDDGQFIEIESISTLEIDVCLLGTSGFLMNRLAEKARQELLMPSPPKNKAERAMRLKHQPYDEYRRSVYRSPDDDGPTRLVFPGGAFRKAIATAALDVPGSSKAQIGRLVRVVEYNVHIYGVPQLSCMIVRQAGINKTPDVRTRAILPEWAARLAVKFAHPLLKEKAVLCLLAAAGDFIGVGDGRNEKGSSLSCGCFSIVAHDNPDFVRVCKAGGLKAQDAALAEPTFYDQETAELLQWFDAELTRRDFDAPARNGRARKEKVPA
jgi:hypothetical protein